ncbi:hypothetical protein F4815DRAFT_134363 [Daldinia loculata]|nr:hypothetical protein F4815DRAFT_134363 [Daldinia loculata]
MANNTDNIQVTGASQLVQIEKQPTKECWRNKLSQGPSNRLFNAKFKADEKFDKLHEKQNEKSNSQLRKEQRKSKRAQSLACVIESDGYYDDISSEFGDKETYSREDEYLSEDEDTLEGSWWSDDEENLFSSQARRNEKNV